jgi:hypothetical protein
LVRISTSAHIRLHWSIMPTFQFDCSIPVSHNVLPWIILQFVMSF